MKMFCPYCGGAMLEGKLRYETGLDWKAKLPGLLAPALNLSGNMLYDQSPAESAYCLQCRLLLVRPDQAAAQKFEEKYYRKIGKQAKEAKK